MPRQNRARSPSMRLAVLSDDKAGRSDPVHVHARAFCASGKLASAVRHVTLSGATRSARMENRSTAVAVSLQKLLRQCS